MRLCEELFSAAKTEFKHLSIFISTISSTTPFGRRANAGMPNHLNIWVINTYTKDYKVIFVACNDGAL